MGWMNDTLSYMKEEPVHRKHHHDKMTFGLVYAFTENFILPLSHDEVVHGKGSLLGRMPGDEWQRFANLRAYFGFMWAHPGKKLLFMGGEFAQSREWNHDASLDWHLLEHAPHRGMQDLVRELNAHYRAEPALHEEDFSDAGFQWIDCTDRDSSVFSWVRWSSRGQWIVSVSNFTPVVRHGFRMGVPEARRYRVLLDTDAARFGGSGVLGTGSMPVDDQGANGRSASIELTLPPLATVWLAPVLDD
jgi:1,4-alpha-glucan branching enzyme